LLCCTAFCVTAAVRRVWCLPSLVVCCGLLSKPVLCCQSLCCAVKACAVLCCAVLCCAVLCCAVLCCAVLCCAVLCCAVPRCAAPRAYACCAVLRLTECILESRVAQQTKLYLEGMEDILSPVDPNASLNLLSHLAAKAELTVAGGLLPPDALPVALPPRK